MKCILSYMAREIALFSENSLDYMKKKNIVMRKIVCLE